MTIDCMPTSRLEAFVSTDAAVVQTEQVGHAGVFRLLLMKSNSQI